MDKKSEEYLRQYIKLTDTIKQKIEAHAARYHIKAEIQLPYIRIPLSVQPARTETGVMKNLREYIKNNENALRDFLLVSNKYDEVKKQMLSDFGITSITDVEVNNMKSFGDYIRQFENYVKDKNWLFQSSYSFFSVNKAINHLREEYDRLITKVDSIAM